jgi:nucleotide-binding universal stress UspA family protein
MLWTFPSWINGIPVASFEVGQNSWTVAHSALPNIFESWRVTKEQTRTVLMKILLAVDGSPCSDEAIEEIGRRPWPVSSEIKVLTAFELAIPPTPETWALPPRYMEEMDRAAQQQAQTIVDRATERLKLKLDAIDIRGEILPGPARILILDTAESWGADLIVVGSHGYRAWERFLLGSVSQSVVSHAKCSVEVVRCPNGHRDLATEPTGGKEGKQ